MGTVVVGSAAPAAAAEPGAVDRAVERVIGPIAERLSGIVFYAVPLGDVEVPLIVVYLIGAGALFTVYFGFINVRGFRHSVDVTRGVYDDPDDPGETSHFQALMTALSATVGLGNIAGVAIAITIGGPGATLWMVVAALVGMSTKFVECSLAVKYRRTAADGSVLGGPMYYLEDGLQQRGSPRWLAKGLAVFFAVAAMGGAIGAGNMFQSNQAYQQFLAVAGDDGVFAANGWAFGLILAVAVAVVIVGGIRSIARVTEKLVPLMAGLYVTAGVVIIAINVQQVPSALGEIVSGAFTGAGVAGGIVGAFIAGIQRAAFSNEAGLGSAAIAHSSARTDMSIRDGFVAQLEPIIDTVIVCTVTALVIVITGVHEGAGAEVEGVTLTSEAFAQDISWFPTVLAVAVIMFAFSTMISWSYYGVQAAEYLFGAHPLVARGFQLVFCAFVVVGAALSLDSVVPLMDSLVFMMCLGNVIGLAVLAPELRRELREYWALHRGGGMPTYAEEVETGLRPGAGVS
ncbi:alanine/glycine:cation symporter family protein [Euzebya sp.]|uniref:alanine/glycine:cation symporter family protein n=1 Tax=Euzebya sp. TaxID=1971409 RepID=UPI003516B7B3